MKSTQNTQIDPATIKAIESVLSKGDRAEVIPVKDGVRVMRVRRETVKGESVKPHNECPVCNGSGNIHADINSIAVCPRCHGARFINAEIKAHN